MVHIILHAIFSSQCFGLLPIHVGSFQLPPPPTLALPSPLRTPPLWVPSPCCLPPPDQSLTQEKQRQMFQEHTTALSPTPQHLPFVLDQQLTPGKNWPYKHAHSHTKNTAAQICTGSTVVQLNEQYTHIHTCTHTYIHTPSAVQIPSVSLIVATLGSGLVSASRVQGLSGQLAWLILLLEATGSQTKGQGPLGGHRAWISGSRVCAICLKCSGFCLF